MEKKFKKLTGVLPMELAEVGDYVQFGAFAWQVIAIEEDRKLLLSVDCMDVDMEWELEQEGEDDLIEVGEDTEENYLDEEVQDLLVSVGIMSREKPVNYAAKAAKIKKYFNEWFCEKYFSQGDLCQIIPQGIDEQVFVLGEEEVEKYLPRKKDRISSWEDICFKVNHEWGLRVNDAAEYQPIVDREGEIIKIVDGYCDYFRPAVWVKQQQKCSN